MSRSTKIGGLYKSILEASSIKAQAFGLFLCGQRTWNVKPIEQKEVDKFRTTLEEYNYPSHLIVPHSSYLANLGAPVEDSLEKSRHLILDGVKRCEALGIDIYNFHPGSSCGKISTKECLEKVADSINYIHSNSNKVILVIENMAKQGHTVGGDFKELQTIISHVKDKSRVGVCFDTCHAFAAGYDLSTDAGFKKTIEEFETTVGFQYLKAIHLNDSKGKLGSKLDRHENIGRGYLGEETFKRVVNEPKFKNIPMILETPFVSNDTYKREIALLYSLIEE
ncbi:putative endonuclease 4-like protein [Dinothrombium tinctorium]|uniref:Putative endonuclease 4-like protein n=1 Tax=Dinothrombium tinctorium TaxID=1965070 RepID=A0A3S4QVF7_9ACAR|nr:putative endonuclease 4-like protein [Dinothrombium tinctorium]RWS16779.1 putative endonuclease 4-like protein [Dinothrombium tinctorium]RWS16903.1 putative endonuclease 4-like protein [Dinothrombium tinctorium]